MPSLTWEESIQLDRERVRLIDCTMSDLGFRQHLPHESHRGPYKFTDLILYVDDQSGDSVSVFFPSEAQADRGLDITTQAKFNNKNKSPEWQSVAGFAEKVGSWIEKCRREIPHG